MPDFLLFEEIECFVKAKIWRLSQGGSTFALENLKPPSVPPKEGEAQ